MDPDGSFRLTQIRFSAVIAGPEPTDGGVADSGVADSGVADGG
jgi:hypothetical protein